MNNSFPGRLISNCYCVHSVHYGFKEVCNDYWESG